jgi:succinoglycan biosynthesis protein ExoA
MTGLPLVSVIIPARNEERDIRECIDALTAQDYPHDHMEVVVVDSESPDGTARVALEVLATCDFATARVVRNRGATTPSNLNRGLAESRGQLVCRVDARCRVPFCYVRRCVEVLTSLSNIAVVGGAQVATAGPNSNLVERAIARALNNPYAMGWSRYRRRSSSGPCDTVYLGAFRRDQLLHVGGWDERLLTNQDYELNRRMSRLGLVWFEAGLEVKYRPRRSLSSLAQQYRRFGRWKLAGWVEGGTPIAPRQLALVVAPVACAALSAAVIRRNPWLPAGAVAVAFALLDAGVQQPAPALERGTALLASALVAGSWYAGVLEQVARHVAGQRLLAKNQAEELRIPALSPGT